MLTHNDLLVLGLLLDRPMHGYEIAQTVKNEGVATWSGISTPAIYYSLNKLHRHSLISSTQVRDAGMEKSVYYLTQKGREAFFAGMETCLGSAEPVRFEYDLAIFLLNKLPQERALALLEKRLAFLKDWETTLEEARTQRSVAGEPLHVAILEHGISWARMEKEWLAGIVSRIHGEAGQADSHQGFMLLTGNLRDFHLPDLIKLIVSGKHSGTLTVTDGTFTRTLTFHQGRPVCATSRRPEGEIQNPQQILDNIYDLFCWQEGAFTFDQKTGAPEGCLVLHMSAESLILNGARWVDNWTVVQRVVPSSDIVFERRAGVECSSDLELTDEECRVFQALDGLRTVTEVAWQCDLTEFETGKILYGLYGVGLIQPGDLDKVRLRRLFRECAELLCQSTKPYRASADDFSCENEINQRCSHLPIRFARSRIEDRTDPSLRTDELARIYKEFLTTQRTVVQERFGDRVIGELLQRVRSQIGMSLTETLERYNLL